MKPKFSKEILLKKLEYAKGIIIGSKEDFKQRKLEDMENFELGRQTAYEDLIRFIKGEIKEPFSSPEELEAQKTTFK